jgi:hypothetical protein
MGKCLLREDMLIFQLACPRHMLFASITKYEVLKSYKNS